MRRASPPWMCAVLVAGIATVSTGVRLRAQDSTRAGVLAAGPRIAWAHVTYLSGPSVYIDAGTLAGLKEGSRLQVRRDTVWIAELVVAFVSSRRASCTVSRSSAPVVVGDSAQFEAADGTLVVGTDGAVRPAPPTSSRLRGVDHALRGRLGIRYLAIDPGSGGARLSQPAFDVRLDGDRFGDLPLGLAIDIRARRALRFRTSTASAGTMGNDTRVYQAMLQLHSGSAGRLSVGRQFSTAMSTVVLFDGLAADFDWRHVSAGAFAGTQPDPFTLGLSSGIREYGVYTQVHNAPNGSGIWSFTTGAIGSYAGTAINREFLYLQGLLVTRRVSVYAAQEMDYNRGWKIAAGEPTTSPTSTFANVRVALTDALSITGGVDNRRNVRLYRDWISPETEFDDSFREGIWSGLSLITGHVEMGADTRSSSGGVAGHAVSYTTSAGIMRLTPLRLGFRARQTRYSGDVADGELRSGSVEITPFVALRVELNAGVRDERRAVLGQPAPRVSWFGSDADVGIGRSLFLLFSTYRETRGLDRSNQAYVALSWRF